jgi:hypothetical protein
LDGSSYPEIVSTDRDGTSAFHGVIVGIAISLVLWAAIAALVWFVIRL